MAKSKAFMNGLSRRKGTRQQFAAVMRPYAQTLVVESEADLEQVIAYARQQKLKDFSIFCLAHVQEKGKPVPRVDSSPRPRSLSCRCKAFLERGSMPCRTPVRPWKL